MCVKSVMFLFFTISICCGQTNLIIIKSVNGSVNSFKISDIREITFEGETTDINERQRAQNILESFALFQNFPNPFNPGTNIKYRIFLDGIVKVNIYDVQGRLVKILWNSQQTPGDYSVYWDGRNESGATVSSGTYFCSVIFNNTQLTKKLLLIK